MLQYGPHHQNDNQFGNEPPGNFQIALLHLLNEGENEDKHQNYKL